MVVACGAAAPGAWAGWAVEPLPAGAGSACWRGTDGRVAGAPAGRPGADGALGAGRVGALSGRTAGITWVASSSTEPADGSFAGALVSVSAGSSSKMDSPGRSLIGGASVVCWLIRARTSDVGPSVPESPPYIRAARPGTAVSPAEIGRRDLLRHHGTG